MIAWLGFYALEIHLALLAIQVGLLIAMCMYARTAEEMINKMAASQLSHQSIDLTIKRFCDPSLGQPVECSTGYDKVIDLFHETRRSEDAP